MVFISTYEFSAFVLRFFPPSRWRGGVGMSEWLVRGLVAVWGQPTTKSQDFAERGAPGRQWLPASAELETSASCIDNILVTAQGSLCQELRSRRNLSLQGQGRETVLRWNLTKKVLKQILKMNRNKLPGPDVIHPWIWNCWTANCGLQ